MCNYIQIISAIVQEIVKFTASFTLLAYIFHLRAFLQMSHWHQIQLFCAIIFIQTVVKET